MPGGLQGGLSEITGCPRENWSDLDEYWGDLDEYWGAISSIKVSQGVPGCAINN